MILFSDNPNFRGSCGVYVSRLLAVACMCVTLAMVRADTSHSFNPNFRGTWYGTNKFFLNALYFSSMITTAANFGEEGGVINEALVVA